MDNNRFILKILFVLQIICLTSTQDLNIIRVGGSNFASVNLYSDSDYTLMGTSGFPFTKEKIIYDIGGNLFNYYYLPERHISFNKNVTISGNYTSKNFTGLSFLYFNYWVSISGTNEFEIYDLLYDSYYNDSIEHHFGYKNIIEFGSAFQFVYEGNISYVFPFIIEEENMTEFVLFMVDSGNLPFFNTSDYEAKKEIKKSKVISCLATSSPSKIICLSMNREGNLTAQIYSETLEKQNRIILNTTTGDDNENMFFKGINYMGNISFFAYYTSYEDSFLRIDVKKLDIDSDYEINLFNYGSYDTLLIDAKDFNKHYMLNDLVKLNNNDIYFAASSIDRETLYIIIFRLNTTKIVTKTVTINLYQKYKLKFYKDLKLVNAILSPVLGFSHCNYFICDESSSHSSSFVIFNEYEENYDYDLIQNLYTSNSIIVDFNIYKSNILGLQFKSIYFEYIPSEITLLSPGQNSTISIGNSYYNSTFELKIDLQRNGSFTINYIITFEDNFSNTRRNLRRLFSEEKFGSFNIILKKSLSYECDDSCTICTLDNPSECIICKYNYSFVGGKKLCMNENNDVNNSQIGEIYELLKDNIEDQNFITIEQGNSILQYSTVEDQLNNNDQDISSVDLGECETLLREQEGLEETEQFNIIKIDTKSTTVSAVYVQYELYNPRTNQKVDMTVCKDSSITIHTPVTLSEEKLSLISSLEESGYNAFDIRDSFYNDICTTYTAENGADIVLSARKTLIYDKNKDIYFCQSGCEFDGNFDIQSSKAQCNCKVKSDQDIVTDITQLHFDKTIFADSFYKALFNSNFRVLQCFKLVFSTKGLKTNAGSYIMSALLGLFIAFIVLHLLTGQKNLVNIINNALKIKGIDMEKAKKVGKEKEQEREKEKEKEKEREKEKEKEKEKKKNKEKEKDKLKEDKKEDKKDGRRKSVKKKSHRKHKKDEKDIKIDDLQAAPKRRHSKGRKSTVKETEKPEEIVVNTNNDLLDPTSGVKENEEKDDKKHKHHRHSHSHHHISNDEKLLMEQAKGLNDEEINSLDYEIALIVDRRSYCQYYLSLLRRKHLILFTFLPLDDYNLYPMKILLFIVSFSLYFTINGFFFSDETMNKIYEDNGAYNFIYQLPQIFYSSLISVAVNMLLKMLSLSEKQILDIKREPDPEKAKELAEKTKKRLNLQLIIFIVLSFLLMLSFWYFISCFCAVYVNTQATLIEDTLISFGLSMLYPFALNIFPGICRIPALRAPKQDKKLKYKISGYVALV